MDYLDSPRHLVGSAMDGILTECDHLWRLFSLSFLLALDIFPLPGFLLRNYHRLNIELDLGSLFRLLCTVVLIG
jgi:hypothetical protein